MGKRTSKAHREAGTATHEPEEKRGWKKVEKSGGGISKQEYEKLSSSEQNKLKDNFSSDLKEGKIDVIGEMDVSAFRYGDPEIQLSFKSPNIKDKDVLKSVSYRAVLKNELAKPKIYSNETREKLRKGEKVNLTKEIYNKLNKIRTPEQEKRAERARRALYGKGEFND